MAELEGLDFSTAMSNQGSLQINLSSSMEDLVPKPAEQVYPDISGAFRELRGNVYPSGAGFGAPAGAFPNRGGGGGSGGVGYGWNMSVLGGSACTSPAFGLSTNQGPPPSTAQFPAGGVSAIQRQGSPQSMNSYTGGAAVNRNMAGAGGGHPAAGFGVGYLSVSAAYDGKGYPVYQMTNPFYGGMGPTSGNAPAHQLLGVNNAMTKSASWNNILDVPPDQGQGMMHQGGDFTDLFPPPTAAGGAVGGGEFDENSDLMEFRPGLPEHEYLSLDFFDPLYERGRKESVCVTDMPAVKGQNYSFGEAFPSMSDDKRPPPELRRHIRHASHEIWGVSTSGPKSAGQAPIGFEAVTAEEMFGSSDAEFLQGQVVDLSVSETGHAGSVPPRPPPPVKTKQVSVVAKRRVACMIGLLLSPKKQILYTIYSVCF
jgi:hypothetical protein